MRVRMLGSAAAAAVLAAALLTACVPEEPEPDPTPTGVFATEEEALAAAEEAYAAYLLVSDQILADGGEEPERLLEVATEELYASELEGFQRRQSEGLRSVGATTFRGTQLESYDSGGAVSMRTCVDISGVDVVDEAGNSVVPPDRVDFATFDLSFSGTPLRLEGKAVSQGESLC